MQAIVVVFQTTHLVLVSFLVVLRVDQLRNDLSGMAGRIEVVGVLAHLFLRALLAAVSRENVLVVVKVVVVVLVEESLGHIYFWLRNCETREFVAVTDNVSW